MGLDCSHGAFHGSYSAFNRLRQAICYVIGGSYPPHMKDNFFIHSEEFPLDPDVWYWGCGYSQETHPGLYAFLSHSDCDGELSPEECSKVADELEAIIPRLKELNKGGGHILGQGGYAAVCQRFIDGCRQAAQLGEPLIFG